MPASQTSADSEGESLYPKLKALLGSAFQQITALEGQSNKKCRTLIPQAAAELEGHLKILADALIPPAIKNDLKAAEDTMAMLRRAYAKKLTTATTEEALEDTLFEIEVAARASQILDKNSLSFERSISRSESNSEREQFGHFWHL